MPETDYELKLQKPAYLRVETSDGQHSARIDVFIAWRFLSDKANAQPSEDLKWISIRQWLAEQLGVSLPEVAENVAREFNEAIVAIGKRVQDDLKKTAEQIVSLQPSILVSQETTQTGQTT